MSGAAESLKRKPWFSSIGLLLLAVSIFGGMIVVKQAISNNPQFGGFAGFGVIAVWLITIPLSFLLGIISIAINERPKALSITLLILCSIPIVYYLVAIVPLS